MANKDLHLKWGCKYPLPSHVIESIYSLIDKPKQYPGYLDYLTRVTEWWDDKFSDYIPPFIRKNCKSLESRVKLEKEYQQFKRENPKIYEAFLEEGNFFYGRKIGKGIGRVKGIGDFPAYLQRKFVSPGGTAFIKAWYLHQLIEYCENVKDLFEVEEIVKRNKDRVAAEDNEYDEVTQFIRNNWEEIKDDF